MDRSAPCFTIKVTKEGDTKGTKIGVDVQANITTFAFEDAEKSHKLALEVDNFDLREFESPTFVQGAIIQFSYGYADEMSPPCEAVIVRSFGVHKHGASKTVSLNAARGKEEGGVKLKVEALGKEFLMNKELRTRSFENVKRSDVAKTIAQENGFGQSETFIDDTEVVLPVILQSRMSSYQFLRTMAQKEGFEVYVDATGFHFHKRKLGQKPAKVLTYYTDGDGTIKSFSLESAGGGANKPGAVVAKGIDLLKGKAIEARGDDTSTKGRDTLASVMEVVGEKVDEKTGAVTPDAALAKNRASEATVATTAATKDDAQRQANGAFQKTQMAAVIVKAILVGDPLIRAKSIVELRGIGSMYSGRYYVSKAKHTINSSGYQTEIECRRDGSNGAASASNKTSSGSQNTASALDPNELVPVEVVDAKAGYTRVEFKPRGSVAK